MTTRAMRVAVLALLAVTGVATPLRAQGGRSGAPALSDSVLEARTREISSTLRCPVCQGESIQDSPAELAQEMRAVVRDQLRAGKTPAEIRAYFVSKYGEWILLEPTMSGFNILLYVFPVVLIAGGLVAVGVLVRRWSTPPDAPTPQ